jgi:rhodanese-related sulfurtransferase
MAIAEIDVDELEEQLAEGARLIDVRQAYEFDEMRVAGAVLVPLATVPDNVDAFRSERPVYVICKTGARSARACEFLAAQGVEAVNVAGGTLAWIRSGRDYVSGNE